MADTIPTAFTVPLVEYTRLANERDNLRKELERLSEIEAILREGNDKLRSAHAIASRDGVDTNWVAFSKQVTAALVRQSLILSGTEHETAATCTAKTFRLPPVSSVDKRGEKS